MSMEATWIRHYISESSTIMTMSIPTAAYPDFTLSVPFESFTQEECFRVLCQARHCATVVRDKNMGCQNLRERASIITGKIIIKT